MIVFGFIFNCDHRTRPRHQRYEKLLKHGSMDPIPVGFVCDRTLNHGNASALYVHDEVVTVAQHWGDAVFHFMIEVLPRLATVQQRFVDQPNVKIHIITRGDRIRKGNGKGKSNRASPDGVTGVPARLRPSPTQVELLELMGFSADRVVVGPVKAKLMHVPAATTCGTPTRHQVLSLRRALLQGVRRSLALAPLDWAGLVLPPKQRRAGNVARPPPASSSSSSSEDSSAASSASSASPPPRRSTVILIHRSRSSFRAIINAAALQRALAMRYNILIFTDASRGTHVGYGGIGENENATTYYVSATGSSQAHIMGLFAHAKVGGTQKINFIL